MNSQLSFVAAQSHQHDLLRRTEAVRPAPEVPAPRRVRRVRLTLPQFAVGRWLAAIRSAVPQA